ncbi:hypothetical protein MKZ15_06250 [Paenibacillus sp. FSL R7-0216]|uniref:hypothetical protein n=1 Tax=Paenibacillus sp. FSL R7-0216 TaxID=2921677 RepID=UPI0030DBBCC4
MSNGISWIQVPDSIIRDPNISALDFCILLSLKYAYYLSGSKDNMFEMDFNVIKRALDINDNRTLKKSLAKLHKQKYIINDVVIHRKKLSEVMLNKVLFNKPFTQLPTKLLSRVEVIGFIGIRLLYYYESFIVRSETMNQFCYASQEAIQRDTGISIRSIVQYNKELKKAKLLDITEHKVRVEYDKDGNMNWERYSNHYDVRLENLL